MLSDLEGITIFGCAQEPAKVLALVEEVQPDVVILDLHAPGPAGLMTLRQLKHLQPAPVVIVLSHYELPPLREACLSAGADYFLEKTRSFERLREVLAGLVQAGQGAVGQLDRPFKS
jgi:DNA-binding NarL/FixJ family response regulator